MPVDDTSHPDQLRTNYEYLKDQIKIIREKYFKDLKVESVELSFDNGKTFEQVSKNDKWLLLLVIKK